MTDELMINDEGIETGGDNPRTWVILTGDKSAITVCCLRL
jgi:hypothetical protein